MKKKKQENVAPRVNLRGLQKWLNAVEAPKIENKRLMSVLLLVATAVLLEGIGMWKMLPLKERVPFVVREEVDASGTPTGHVSVQQGGIERFNVTETHLRYALREWAENLLSVDAATPGLRLPSSYKLLRGQAIKDWHNYVENQAKPLEQLAADPSYRVTADVISINFIVKGKTAMVRVQLRDNQGHVKRVVINLDYAILPISSEADSYRSPIGLWITSFGVSNEIA